MSFSQGKKAQLKTAFQRVYGKTVDTALIHNYAAQILNYGEEYPFESPELFQDRLMNIQFLEQEDRIIEYFSKIPDGIVPSNVPAYQKLFELGKRYGVGFIDDEATSTVTDGSPSDIDSMDSSTKVERSSNAETNSSSVDSSTGDVADTINKNNTTEPLKEEMTMSETKTNTNVIDDLENEANSMGVGDKNEEVKHTDSGSAPKVASNSDKLAAKRAVSDTLQSRQNFAEKARIEKIIVTRISKISRAVAGKDAMGTIRNWDSAWDRFCRTTGMHIEKGDDGVERVEFSKLANDGEKKNAMEIYNTLMDAKNKPEETLIKPALGDAEVRPSIKAVVLRDDNNKVETIKYADLPAIILNNSLMFIQVANEESQFQIEIVNDIEKAARAGKKTYSVRIHKGPEMYKDTNLTVDGKELTETHLKKGEGKVFYSDMKVKCKSDDPSRKNKVKMTTFRIPLRVDQFEEIVVPAWKDLFKSSGVGSETVAKEANPKDIEDLQDKLSRSVAEESASGRLKMTGATATAFKDAVSELNKEAENAVNSQMGGTVEDDDMV